MLCNPREQRLNDGHSFTEGTSIAGLLRPDVKRPSELTLIPWQRGRCMTWDVTVIDTLAKSYQSITATPSAAAAEDATDRKELKYQGLEKTHTFRFKPILLKLTLSVSTFCCNRPTY